MARTSAMSSPVMLDLDAIREQINQELEIFFEQKLQSLTQSGSGSRSMVENLREFTLRPGKRIRPIMVLIGYAAATGDVPPREVLRASLCTELLQSYLLIQDDWMDEDAMRRGKPSMHFKLRASFEDRQVADSVSFLISDLASSFAEELLVLAPIPAEARLAALKTYTWMHQQVVCGQFLDVTHHSDVRQIHELKTASYTVTGPLLLGAGLGSGSDELATCLRNFGNAIGLAFQARDDYIGTFGSQAKSGKLTNSDLQQKKSTILLKLLQDHVRDAEQEELIHLLSHDVLNAQMATRIKDLMIHHHIPDMVETEIDKLYQEAMEQLDRCSFSDEAKGVLRKIASLLVHREG
ncbi:MAG: polyprenyl synthetase family protein [Myxococcota bacterium]|nr:polyprenyl synthetase family protein [Myxococcota bacterium]